MSDFDVTKVNITKRSIIDDLCVKSNSIADCSNVYLSYANTGDYIICNFILIFFFVKALREYWKLPCMANKQSVIMIIQGIIYFMSCSSFYTISRTEARVYNFRIISIVAKCFIFVMSSKQAIFLISLISNNFSKLLYWILQTYSIVLYILSFIAILLIFDVVDDSLIFNSKCFNIITLNVEVLVKCFYTFTCSYGFAFSKKSIWLLSPSYVKSMKVVIFIVTFLNFFSHIFNIFKFMYKGNVQVIWKVQMILNNCTLDDYRKYNMLIYLIKNFLFNSLPILISTISMLYLKPKNDTTSKTDDKDETEILQMKLI